MQINHRTSFPSTGVAYTRLPLTNDSTQRLSYFDPYSGQQQDEQPPPITIVSNPNIYQYDPPNSPTPSNGYQYPPPMIPMMLPQAQQLANPSQPRLGSSNAGIIRILGKTVIAIVFSIGISLAFFLYLFYNRTAWSASTLQIAVPLGDVLLLFSILSKLTMTCIPIVMSIAAFHIADSWLRRQKIGQQGAGVSPYQYNLILDIFTGATIFSAWKTLRYLARPAIHPHSPSTAHSHTKARHTRYRLSYVLETSIITLLVLLVIAYAIFGVDFALHHLSIPVLVQKPAHTNDSKANSYGRQLKSECLLLNPKSGTPCTIIYEFGEGFLRGRMDAAYIADYSEALNVAKGTSNVNKVIVANDGEYQVAALVPADHAVTPGSSYEAQTTGMHAECEAVTSSCAFASTSLESSTASCMVSGYPELGAIVGSINPVGQIGSYLPDRNIWSLNESGSNGTEANPYIFSFTAAMYTESTMETLGVEPNGVWGHGVETPLSFLVLICKATIVDVTFQYRAINNSYSIVSSTPSTNNATIRSISAVLDVEQAPFEDFFEVLQSIALSVSTPNEFLRSLEMQYAKMYLPFAHAAFEPIPASRAEVVEIVQGSSIHTPWLLAYLALLMLFGLFALLQGMLALGSNKTAVWRPNMKVPSGRNGVTSKKASSEGTWINITQLAAERLTTPAALAFEAFERSENDVHSQALSLQSVGPGMFKETTKGMSPGGRIGIGFSPPERNSDMGKAKSVFGLFRI